MSGYIQNIAIDEIDTMTAEEWLGVLEASVVAAAHLRAATTAGMSTAERLAMLNRMSGHEQMAETARAAIIDALRRAEDGD